MKVHYTIYLVRDSCGHEDFAVSRDKGCDVVQISGMVTKAGVIDFFESEAAHMEKWCLDEGYEYREVERVTEWKI